MDDTVDDTLDEIAERLGYAEQHLAMIKKQFESYKQRQHKTEDMTFGEALEAMKQGKKVSESVFIKGVYFAIQQPDCCSKMTLPYIYCHDRNGDLSPCTFENKELLSNKWFIVE